MGKCILSEGVLIQNPRLLIDRDPFCAMIFPDSLIFR
jgi:hypothetical protein